MGGGDTFPKVCRCVLSCRAVFFSLQELCAKMLVKPLKKMLLWALRTVENADHDGSVSEDFSTPQAMSE